MVRRGRPIWENQHVNSWEFWKDKKEQMEELKQITETFSWAAKKDSSGDWKDGRIHTLVTLWGNSCTLKDQERNHICFPEETTSSLWKRKTGFGLLCKWIVSNGAVRLTVEWHLLTANEGLWPLNPTYSQAILLWAWKNNMQGLGEGVMHIPYQRKIPEKRLGSNNKQNRDLKWEDEWKRKRCWEMLFSFSVGNFLQIKWLSRSPTYKTDQIRGSGSSWGEGNGLELCISLTHLRSFKRITWGALNYVFRLYDKNCNRANEVGTQNTSQTELIYSFSCSLLVIYGPHLS